MDCLASGTQLVLEALPVPPFVLFVVQGLVAGFTINAVAALVEELVWGGFLLNELSPLVFWKVFLTGIVWGFWHALFIFQGHNFPEMPVIGTFVMVVWAVAVSPVLTYLTVCAQSVLAAALFHGSFNGVGFISLVYLSGGGRLLVSPVGLAGIGAALFCNGLCVLHDRFVASDQLTTSGALSPWR